MATEQNPTNRLIRMPNMIADSTSRPCESVPSGLSQSDSAAGQGGLKLSSSERLARSVGSWGAIHGANVAASISTSATMADAIATGERRNPWTKSLSRKPRARVPVALKANSPHGSLMPWPPYRATRPRTGPRRIAWLDGTTPGNDRAVTAKCRGMTGTGRTVTWAGRASMER